jgi:hypothetical protein
MAMLMSLGEGVTKQPLRAFEQFRRLAEEGFGKAQCNMGKYYAEGGTPRRRIFLVFAIARAKASRKTTRKQLFGFRGQRLSVIRWRPTIRLVKDALRQCAVGQKLFSAAFHTAASGISGNTSTSSSSSRSAAATVAPAAASAATTPCLRRTTAQFPQCAEATLAVKYLRKFMFKHDNV